MIFIFNQGVDLDQWQAAVNPSNDNSGLLPLEFLVETALGRKTKGSPSGLIPTEARATLIENRKQLGQKDTILTHEDLRRQQGLYSVQRKYIKDDPPRNGQKS